MNPCTTEGLAYKKTLKQSTTGWVCIINDLDTGRCITISTTEALSKHAAQYWADCEYKKLLAMKGAQNV